MGNSSTDIPERRHRPRSHVRIAAELHTPSGVVNGTTVDMSTEGAFISTPRQPQVGTGVRLSLGRGPARNPLVLQAEVVRIGNQREGRFAGVGLRFLEMTALDEG